MSARAYNAGHGLGFRWLKRRSPSVVSVGDELETTNFPTSQARGRIVRAAPPVLASFPESREPEPFLIEPGSVSS